MHQHCKTCNAPVPFQACPTCPPVTYICHKCGTETLVTPAPLDETLDVIKRYKERHS